MEAILKFNLPDDQEEFDLAVNGSKCNTLIWELDQLLRAKIKYDDKLSNDTIEAYEFVREKIRELAYSNGIKLEI